jgi:hypothetical protein
VDGSIRLRLEALQSRKRGEGDPSQRPLSFLPTRCDAVSTGAWLWLTSVSEPDVCACEGVPRSPECWLRPLGTAEGAGCVGAVVDEEYPDPPEDADDAFPDENEDDVMDDIGTGVLVLGGGTWSTGGADKGPVGPFGNSALVAPGVTATVPRLE